MITTKVQSDKRVCPQNCEKGFTSEKTAENLNQYLSVRHELKFIWLFDLHFVLVSTEYIKIQIGTNINYINFEIKLLIFFHLM